MNDPVSGCPHCGETIYGAADVEAGYCPFCHQYASAPSIAMQSRCLGCLREIYGPGVYAFSLGHARCNACGRKPEQMSDAGYRSALAIRRAKE